MFNNMAVPDIQTSNIKQGLDARDLAWIGNNGILEACFPGFRVSHGTTRHLTVYNLKAHQVEMDRVGVFSEVVDDGLSINIDSIIV